MPFVPNQTAPHGRFVPDEQNDFTSNVVDDALGIGKGTLEAGSTLFNAGMGIKPQETGQRMIDMAKGLPGAIIDEGKRIGAGELITGNPIEAAKKFGQAAYEKPLTTAMDVLPLAGAFKAGKVANVSSVADDAVRGASSSVDDVARLAPEAPGAINLGDEAAQILKEPIAPKSAPSQGSHFQDTVSNLKNSIPVEAQEPIKQVEKFLSKKYQRLADNPSAVENIGDMMERKAQSLKFKEVGANPGQIRALYRGGMSEDQIRGLSDWMDDKGITEPIRGYTIGKRINKIAEESGRVTGGIRKIATQRGATHDPNTLVQKIRAELDQKYLGGGSASGEKGAYIKALKDIEKAPPTAEGIAEAATALNKYANANKMTQPKGARTDVANVASRINNGLIEKVLSPAEIETYSAARSDFGASQIANKFYANRIGRELSGRSSGIGGLWGEAKNFVADAGGNKLFEKSFSKIGKKLKANPSMAKNFGTLSEEVLNDVLSALDEVIDETGVRQ